MWPSLLAVNLEANFDADRSASCSPIWNSSIFDRVDWHAFAWESASSFEFILLYALPKTLIDACLNCISLTRAADFRCISFAAIASVDFFYFRHILLRSSVCLNCTLPSSSVVPPASSSSTIDVSCYNPKLLVTILWGGLISLLLLFFSLQKKFCCWIGDILDITRLGACRIGF